MRLLLDTHVWIWRLLEPERLSDHAADVLADPEHEIQLSPVSVWETLVLARKGRLRLEPSPAAWVRSALRVSAPVMAPLTHEIALRSEDLPGYGTDDPADRFLVATALIEGLTLATADRAMLDYQGLETLAAI